VPQFGLIAGEKIFDGAKFLPHVLKVGTRVSISDAEFLTASTSHPRLFVGPAVSVGPSTAIFAGD
jgi:hypothetical protein